MSHAAKPSTAGPRERLVQHLRRGGRSSRSTAPNRRLLAAVGLTVALMLALSPCRVNAQDEEGAGPRGDVLAGDTIEVDALDHPGVRYDLPRTGNDLPASGLGHVVARAGFLNRDRFADLLIAADGAGTEFPGRVWVLFGGHSARSSTQSLGDLGPGQGTRLRSGLDGPDRFGAFVSGAGDVNDDGFDDFLIGMPSRLHPSLERGGVYLLFGSQRTPGDVDLSDLRRVGLLLVAPAQQALLGLSGAGIGDVNADGIDDFALGIPDAIVPGPDGPRPRGRVVVIFGDARMHLLANNRVPIFPIDDLTAPLGVVIDGALPLSGFGHAIAGVGDLDSDGVDDFAIGAPLHGRDANPGGAVFVIFGGAHLDNGAPDLGEFSPANVLRIETRQADARLGGVLTGGRDVTGDGVDDLALGVVDAARDNITGVGLVAIVAGRANLRDSRSLGLANADFTLWGRRGSEAGAAVGFVPDRTGDGVAEMLVGAPALDEGRGRAYLVHGGEALEDEILLDELSPGSGKFFTHRGAGRPQLGRVVAGIEDRDGDGSGEIILGAPGFRPNRDDNVPPGGAVYEIYSAAASESGPRNLGCRPLSRGRVRLSWTLTSRADSLQILRSDGNGELRVIDSVPGDLLVYIDPQPGEGEHRYAIQANDDSSLRSGPCTLQVRPLGVESVQCERVPGTRQIRVGWTSRDSQFLTIKVDGEVVEGFESVPPAVSSVLLTLPDQNDAAEPYLIEVCSRDDSDHGCAGCRIAVPRLALERVTDFVCRIDPNDRSHVELSWTSPREYDTFEILRNSVLIARVSATDAGGSFVDPDVPRAGRLNYGIRGLVGRTHPGPVSTCAIDVQPDPTTRISGHVVFDDRISTPVRRGDVFVYSRQRGGELVGVASVTQSGRFSVAVDLENDAYDLEFRAAFVDSRDELREVDVLPIFKDDTGRPALEDYTPGELFASLSEVTVDARGDPELRVALPIIAVNPDRSGVDRWRGLRNRLVDTDGSLLFVSATTGGVASGAIRIRRDLQNARDVMARQFGSVPAQFDMAAFGFSGLAARLHVHTSETCDVRRLVLIGTPNLGTPRALVELRSDAGARPGPGGHDALTDLRYRAADEQTIQFLGLFNDRVSRACGTVVHLIAGVGGRSELDGVLGCDLHDGRVCVESALAEDIAVGNFASTRLHEIDEDHAALGRGPASLDLLLDGIGLGIPVALAGEAGRAPAPQQRGAGLGGDEGEGGGAGDLPTEPLSLGKVTHGDIGPGDEGSYFFSSDTSGSIIIILNAEDEGSLDFTVVTPDGTFVDSANAGNHNAVYVSYNDGEGNLVQTYKFLAGQVGSYEVAISSDTENPLIRYVLEFHLDSPVKLHGELDDSDVELGSTPLLTTELLNAQLVPPELVLETTARLIRPDGGLELLALADDGQAGDDVAGDGIYSAVLPETTQPGYHVVEVQTNDGVDPTFERAATLQLLVRSDLASLRPDFDSGANDLPDGDGDGGGAGEEGLKESLWIAGSVESTRGGSLVVLGSLTDQDDNPVAQSGTIFSLESARPADFRIDFDGYEIFGSERDGPYVLRDIEILDAGVGFVRADLLVDAHTTSGFLWSEFSVEGGLPYLRGDANVDQQVDLSDTIVVLEALFLGGDPDEILPCADAADANADGEVDVSDAVEIINFLFLGLSPTLQYPFPECDQGLVSGCHYYPHCR